MLISNTEPGNECQVSKNVKDKHIGSRSVKEKESVCEGEIRREIEEGGGGMIPLSW